MFNFGSFADSRQSDAKEGKLETLPLWDLSLESGLPPRQLKESENCTEICETNVARYWTIHTTACTQCQELKWLWAGFETG